MTTSPSVRHRRPLDIGRAAEYLRIKVRFVRRMAEEYRILSFKIGRFVQLDPDFSDRFRVRSLVAVAGR